MKTILLTLLFSLPLVAMDASDIQKSYEMLKSELVQNGPINDVATTGLIISFILGLLVGYFIFKYLHVKSVNRKNQMAIKDLEDEKTNLEGQIKYIELQNKTLVEEVDEKVLYFANENQALMDKNLELTKKMDKAIKDRDTLLRQVEETIIFE